MPEIVFYHLEKSPLEKVLPDLLEKTLERGWRAVVQASSPERVAALDQLLWTYNDDGFLPHGTAEDGNEALQPVFLTTAAVNPNGARLRFFVDGAGLPEDADTEAYDRLVHLFDGADETAVDAARQAWKSAAASGHEATYWRQDDNGRWRKQ